MSYQKARTMAREGNVIRLAQLRLAREGDLHYGIQFIMSNIRGTTEQEAFDLLLGGEIAAIGMDARIKDQASIAREPG